MQTRRSTVYIPLVEQSQQNSQLLEVYAEDTSAIVTKAAADRQAAADKKAEDKNLNPVTAALRYASLAGAGLHVVNAIRKLGLKPSRWAAYQGIKDYAWLDSQRLYVGNSHFENCEGNSAQLGLAIALLLNASDSPVRYAIATGSISTDKLADNDVPIGAVGSVPEKLALILEKRKAKALPEQPLYCFTPTHYKKNGDLYPVSELAQIKLLADVGIQVRPIEWLSEAASILKADRARRLKQDRLVEAAAAGLLGLLLAVLGYQTWWHWAIPVNLLPLADGSKAEPFLVCANKDKSEVWYVALEHDTDTPILPLFKKENPGYNLGLGWKLQPAATLPFSSPYYVAFIHLGERTGFKLVAQDLGTQADITVAAGEALKWYWPMKEESAQQQNNALLVVLQRTPIATAKLQAELDRQFLGSKDKLDVQQALNFLQPKFPGHYTFKYKSVLRDNPCIRP